MVTGFYAGMRVQRKADAAERRLFEDAKRDDEKQTSKWVKMALRQLGLQREKSQPPPSALMIQAVAQRAESLSKYPCQVAKISGLPDFTTQVYPDWLTKVEFIGTPEDTSERYQVVFEACNGKKRTEASWMLPGMRFRLQLEPFDEQPESLRRRPMADDLKDISLPLYWAKSYEHDDALLKLLATPRENVFAGQFVESVVRSPIEVEIGGQMKSFFFYGNTWGVYRPAPDARIMRLDRGSPRRSVRDVSRFLAEKGITVIFAPVPQAASLFEDVAAGVDRGLENPAPAPNGATLGLLKTLREDGVETVDLTAVLRKQRYAEFENKRYPVSLVNDSHWSPTGAKLAGEAVASYLQEFHPEVAPRVKESLGISERCDVFSNAGDISTLPAVKSLRVETGPVLALRHGLTAADEKAAACLEFDDGNCPIHVIGDSNLDVAKEVKGGFAAHLAKALQQPVCLTAVAAGGNGVALDTWWRNRRYERAKILVWLVAERFLDGDGWIDPEALTPLKPGS